MTSPISCSEAFASHWAAVIPAARVHPHVERSVQAETEASSLHPRAEAKTRQDRATPRPPRSIPRPPAPPAMRPKLAWRCANRGSAIVLRRGHRLGVAVQRDQLSRLAQAAQNLAAMAASAEGAVHIHSICFDRSASTASRRSTGLVLRALSSLSAQREALRSQGAKIRPSPGGSCVGGLSTSGRADFSTWPPWLPQLRNELPWPTSITSFSSPANLRSGPGISIRPAPSISTSYALPTSSRCRSRVRGLKLDKLISFC